MAASITADRSHDAAPGARPKTLKSLNVLLAASPPFVKGGTRAVPGEGPVGAPIALVGEQPGDQEDLQGRPFVGPAGRLLDRAMAEAGLERRAMYVTNAVMVARAAGKAIALTRALRNIITRLFDRNAARLALEHWIGRALAGVR